MALGGTLSRDLAAHVGQSGDHPGMLVVHYHY